MMAQVIADIGAILKMSPCDDVQLIVSEGDWSFIEDRTPFLFKVEGHLYDGQIFYGLFGPVLSGPDRYSGLICNIIVRVDETDWRVESSSQVNFFVGPSTVSRDHGYDFRHPEGIRNEGYPWFVRFADVEVIDPLSG